MNGKAELMIAGAENGTGPVTGDNVAVLLQEANERESVDGIRCVQKPQNIDSNLRGEVGIIGIPGRSCLGYVVIPVEDSWVAKDAVNELEGIDLTDPDLHKAATKIQASFRGHKVRQEVFGNPADEEPKK
ncbi:hypothetical protein WN48_07532 [Eufriesea mexicana]|uniref:Uncharacterized protein n=1 Tax=Eufriesea mexicana TaxID=516756 RepID=A0A310SLW9_9HYME|nr:hypothetical protein WN48_07532 [Eufriesea mexicana]